MNKSHERRGKTWGGILALLLIAVAASVLAIVEFKARGAARNAYQRVQAGLDAGQSIDDAQVHDWLGRQPSRTYEGEEKKFYEVYDYRGVLRTTTIEVEYIKRAAALVNAVFIH